MIATPVLMSGRSATADVVRDLGREEGHDRDEDETQA